MGRERRTDWVSVLEAAYAPSPSDEAWAEAVADACAPLFERALGLTAVRHSADLSSATVAFSTGGLAPLSRSMFDTAMRQGQGSALLRSFFYPSSMVHTMRSLSTVTPRDAFDVADSAFASAGLVDAIGLLMNPMPGLAVVLYAPAATRVSLGSHQEQTYTRLALHVEAALRLRCRPESVRAVVSSTGKVLHLERPPRGRAPRTNALTDRVRRVERARSRQARREPEALALWEALAAGDASLAPRTEGTRRHYLVLDNPPSRRPMRALSNAELDVVTYAARGLSTKMIGYGLGVATSTVSVRLARAASKVGLATRAELVRIAAMLANDPRARFDDSALTRAERDVLDLVSQGLSNQDVARLRGRSIRTIANQVASLLAKTRSPSRRALIAGRFGP